MSKIDQLQKKISFYKSRLERLQKTTTENLGNHLVGEYMSLKNYLTNKLEIHQSELSEIYTQESKAITVNAVETV
ncbi:hypothetical protein [uncultured Aquimarina sp.]|uniref:hypothetical protein n=1 Tax=uncultured Aquimarina sp. TaxID=575652 RepID=UPI00260F58D6|nr:hypothetical protein [uncultured Aquimarina sp.]